MATELQKEIEAAMYEGVLPRKVILRFDDEAERDERGFVIDPKTGLSTPRPKKLKNLATVVAVGEPIDEEDVIFAKIVRPGDEVFAYKDYGKELVIERGDEVLFYYIYQFYEIFFRFPRTEGNR